MNANDVNRSRPTDGHAAWYFDRSGPGVGYLRTRLSAEELFPDGPFALSLWLRPDGAPANFHQVFGTHTSNAWNDGLSLYWMDDERLSWSTNVYNVDGNHRPLGTSQNRCRWIFYRIGPG